MNTVRTLPNTHSVRRQITADSVPCTLVRSSSATDLVTDMRLRYLTLGSNVFPPYVSDAPQVITDPKRFALAKMYASTLFRRHRKRIEQVFRSYLTRRYRRKPSSVCFERGRYTFDPVWRIQNALLVDLPKPLIGLTDGVCIEISSTEPMQFHELVGCLVHEALHTFCTMHGRVLPVHVEHHCMRVLGDQCGH